MLKVRIVLVETSHPGNIGGAARAMKTMGQGELYLVNPKRYPDPQADWRAAGALDVLDAANTVTSVEEAIRDCHWAVGTSTRMRSIPWPVASPRTVAEEIARQPGEQRVAILFGREDNGLSNDELRMCNLHLQIPAAPEYPSLNLAMAVQVVCYELFAHEHDVPDSGWDRPMATVKQVDDMLAHFQDVLVQQGFLDADNPGQTMTRIKRVFKRVNMDDTEVQIFRGICKHFGRAQIEPE